jgi:hypothetical protein
MHFAYFCMFVKACMLAELNIPHALISVVGLEPMNVLRARLAIGGKQCFTKHVIRLSKPAFELQSEWLNLHCEF